MFTFIDNYDVQAVRKATWEEARKATWKEAREAAWKEAREAAWKETEERAKVMLREGQLPENVSRWLNIPLDTVIKIKNEI